MKTLTSILVALSIGAIGAPAVARAATTFFDVSGTAVAFAGQSCGGSCPFSGTLTIDVTTGVATAVDITLPGLSAFDTLVFSGPRSGPLETSFWEIIAGNGASDLAILDLPPLSPTPASLVGFAGGSILGGGAQSSGNDPLYYILPFTGSITAAVVPEPSTWAMTALGFGLLGLLGYRKTRSDNALA
jgi:PEP-CTERM motif